jgi:xanthine dehydrogenase small subunit
LPNLAWRFRCYKVSKRFDQDITASLGAFNARIEGGICRDIRICFGGMAKTPKRAAKTEAVLQGQAWTQATIERACDALAADYQPISDMRAGSRYRLRVAQNLLRKFFIETTEFDAETRVVHAGKRVHAGRRAHG